ncbi:MAG TPA: class I SAM-dependent methyltransferase [Kouleothrix sp.]|uniref:class I SAM-dependent methyltransferase n=1 Tax=Kouleothrix sp. TaxID=2779161 RepID=UPI002BA62F33|nr:class I SAM-dependent methyltransferase [Kouleothrix sp.]HRC74657.1 class I SAM-dependent methyltransferase [Kouleothrix sp.]
MPDLPTLILADGRVDWEALFQIYEFEQYRSYADDLTHSEVDFIETALGLSADAAILDVACGGGRHALELARRGYSVEGVDSSATLVAYATRRAYEQAVRARFAQADMRALSYQQEFDAALVMNSSLGFFDDATNRATVERAAAALVDGGRLLVQCLNPYQIARYLEGFRGGWHHLAGGYLLRDAHFEPREATLHIGYRFVLPAQGIDARYPGDRIRLYGYPELSALLEGAGLRPLAVFGDATMPAVPFEEGSLWQVLVAEKRAE